MERGVFFSIICLSILFLSISCSDFQKAINSKDTRQIIQYAEKMYKEKSYRKAIRLFELEANKYIGRPSGQRITYMYAYSLYHDRQYILASHYVERFIESYTKSEKYEEMMFLECKLLYIRSSKYSLDQSETKAAVSKLQVFLNKFPLTKYLQDVNKMSKTLNDKLDKKYFEIAKQYYHLEDYFSAKRAIEIYLLNHPGTKLREDALYYKLDALIKIAENSIASKKDDRTKEAKNNYQVFIKYYPKSKYLKKLENINKL